MLCCFNFATRSEFEWCEKELLFTCKFKKCTVHVVEATMGIESHASNLGQMNANERPITCAHVQSSSLRTMAEKWFLLISNQMSALYVISPQQPNERPNNMCTSSIFLVGNTCTYYIDATPNNMCPVSCFLPGNVVYRTDFLVPAGSPSKILSNNSIVQVWSQVPLIWYLLEVRTWILKMMCHTHERVL